MLIGKLEQTNIRCMWFEFYASSVIFTSWSFKALVCLRIVLSWEKMQLKRDKDLSPWFHLVWKIWEWRISFYYDFRMKTNSIQLIWIVMCYCISHLLVHIWAFLAFAIVVFKLACSYSLGILTYKSPFFLKVLYPSNTTSLI